MSTTPFSYHLYHRPTKQHYYGIKYSKGSSPTVLWTTYFSSSSVVKKLINDYGADSFDYEIRKTFVDPTSALLWEHKVLRRLDAAKRTDWINRHNGGSKFRAPVSHTEKTKQKIRQKMQGQTRTAETKEKHRVAAKEREALRRANNWTMPTEAIERAISTRQERISSGDINPYSKERNKKMADSKRGTKRHYLPDGSFIMVKNSNTSR